MNSPPRRRRGAHERGDECGDAAGVAANDIYVDHASGAKASRPQLDIVLRMLRDGDTLKITRLDRLGRSVLHLVTLGAELQGEALMAVSARRASMKVRSLALSSRAKLPTRIGSSCA